MNHVLEMLKTHPAESQIDKETLAACIEACFDCAQTCTACADACLGESMVKVLVRCIRLNLDCADVCEATGRLVTRQTAVETAVDAQLWRSQLQACIAACTVCGDECARHANMHAHCRVCADSCRRCAEACTRLLQTLPVA